MNKFLMGVAVAPLLLASQAHATTVLAVSPGSLSFYALPGATTAGETFKVTRASGYTTGTTTASTTAASGSFTGAAITGAAVPTGSAGLVSPSYTFKGASTAGATGESAVSTDTITYSGSNKSSTNVTSTQAATNFALNGYTVAAIGAVTTTYVAPTAPATTNYVLVGRADTFTETVTNTGYGSLAGAAGNLTGTFGTLTGLTGGGAAINLADSTGVAGKTSATASYSFKPTVKGATAVGALTTTLANGKSGGSNAAFSATTAVNLTAVAPVANVSTNAAALARFSTYGAGGVGTTGVTVTNTGNGDLASASLGVQRNLNVSFSSPSQGNSSAFSGPTTNGGLSLTDGATANVAYNFTATARGEATDTVVGAFSNGSADGTNSSFSTTETLVGYGVGPTYNSAVGATAAAAQANLAAAGSLPGAATTQVGSTPTANTGLGAINFGTINSHKSETIYLDIGNTTTDANGGNAQLTDLSLLSDTFANGTAFSVSSISPVIVEGGQEVVGITFNTFGLSGSFSDVLTFSTDSRSAFGQTGDSFSYSLVGTAVPEFSTWGMMLAGFAGLGLVGFGGSRKSRYTMA